MKGVYYNVTAQTVVWTYMYSSWKLFKKKKKKNTRLRYHKYIFSYCALFATATWLSCYLQQNISQTFYTQSNNII